MISLGRLSSFFQKKVGKKEAEGAGNNVMVVLRLDIHCKGCARKVKRAVSQLEGVEKVKAEWEANEVTVTGNVDPAWLRETVELETTKKVELVSTTHLHHDQPEKPEEDEEEEDEKEEEDEDEETKAAAGYDAATAKDDHEEYNNSFVVSPKPMCNQMWSYYYANQDYGLEIHHPPNYYYNYPQTGFVPHYGAPPPPPPTTSYLDQFFCEWMLPHVD